MNMAAPFAACFCHCCRSSLQVDPAWIQLTGIARNVPEMCPQCEIIPTVIVTSFAGSSLLFFVFFVDFARKSELLSDPFLALYDLKVGKEDFLVFSESGGSVLLLVDSADDATRKT